MHKRGKFLVYYYYYTTYFLMYIYLFFSLYVFFVWFHTKCTRFLKEMQSIHNIIHFDALGLGWPIPII